MQCANVLDLYHGDSRGDVPDFRALQNAGIMAIWHKVSQGLNYRDPAFTARRAAAEAIGIMVGGYHFLDASDATAQANNFLSAANWQAGRPLALAVDYEKSEHTPSLQQLMQVVQAIDTITGRSSVIYSSDLIRETLQPHKGGHLAADMIGHEDFFRKHRLWLAEYGPHENVPWPWNSTNTGEGTPPGIWLWQFSATGREPAIVGNVDLNYYAGTQVQLAANWIK